MSVKSVKISVQFSAYLTDTIETRKYNFSYSSVKTIKNTQQALLVFGKNINVDSKSAGNYSLRLLIFNIPFFLIPAKMPKLRDSSPISQAIAVVSVQLFEKG